MENKLLNTVQLEYNAKNLQIIVASDGSTDRTNIIVDNYKKYGVELICIPERKGKENAQREALNTQGERLLYSQM